jgi:hypothetical protein
MGAADLSEEKSGCGITIVRIDDFPKPSTTSEMITRIAGTKQVFNLSNAHADEMRAYVGKTLSREDFVELWRSRKLPLEVVLDLLDELCGPN